MICVLIASTTLDFRFDSDSYSYKKYFSFPSSFERINFDIFLTWIYFNNSLISLDQANISLYLYGDHKFYRTCNRIYPEKKGKEKTLTFAYMHAIHKILFIFVYINSTQIQFWMKWGLLYLPFKKICHQKSKLEYQLAPQELFVIA